MELKQYWNIVKKRLWLIALLVIVSGAATGIYSYLYADKQYEASTKLVVSQKKETSALMAQLELAAINSNIELIKTYKEIIKTPRIMDKVAAQYPDIGLTADELIRKVSVSAVNDTQVMSVTASDVSYIQAAAIVNAVSKVFQEEVPLILQVDNVSILNEANPKAKPEPVSPKPNLNIAISIVLSLMIGLGLTFLIDYLDDTIKTEEDVAEVFGVRALTLIPRMKTSDIETVSEQRGLAAMKRGKHNVELDA
ncbi:lipopolysaccharide biosynthesis protein [Paenibacillus darwinianus]|uniref:Lipopolysaccharide biosynthesis protein n=1 Tax=Paenibacillus darwinianus TaxID=1380763 RepID=A0A9W5S3L8_9BACL|nr:Wzz/FepE/Etk N-terminal domain-containing protein [Paenibacillus darwinianus]EXX91443.1 lipopolysaccharide biosynthesis protein [Paenibacillus darwinianus]